MRFHETLKAAVLAARIERHWRVILRLRKQGSELLAGGNKPNSKHLLRLNRRLDRRGAVAARLERDYEARYVPPLRTSTGNI